MSDVIIGALLGVTLVAVAAVGLFLRSMRDDIDALRAEIAVARIEGVLTRPPAEGPEGVVVLRRKRHLQLLGAGALAGMAGAFAWIREHRAATAGAVAAATAATVGAVYLLGPAGSDQPRRTPAAPGQQPPTATAPPWPTPTSTLAPSVPEPGRAPAPSTQPPAYASDRSPGSPVAPIPGPRPSSQPTATEAPTAPEPTGPPVSPSESPSSGPGPSVPVGEPDPLCVQLVIWRAADPSVCVSL